MGEETVCCSRTSQQQHATWRSSRDKRRIPTLSLTKRASLFVNLFVCLFACLLFDDPLTLISLSILTSQQNPKEEKSSKSLLCLFFFKSQQPQNKKEKEFPLLYLFFLTSHQPKEKTSTPFVYSVSDPNKLQHKRKNTQLHCLLFHRSPTTQKKKKSSFFVYSFPHLNNPNKRRRKKKLTPCVYSYLFLDTPKNKPPFYR